MSSNISMTVIKMKITTDFQQYIINGKEIIIFCGFLKAFYRVIF